MKLAYCILLALSHVTHLYVSDQQPYQFLIQTAYACQSCHHSLFFFYPSLCVIASDLNLEKHERHEAGHMTDDENPFAKHLNPFEKKQKKQKKQ